MVIFANNRYSSGKCLSTAFLTRRRCLECYRKRYFVLYGCFPVRFDALPNAPQSRGLRSWNWTLTKLISIKWNWFSLDRSFRRWYTENKYIKITGWNDIYIYIALSDSTFPRFRHLSFFKIIFWSWNPVHRTNALWPRPRGTKRQEWSMRKLLSYILLKATSGQGKLVCLRAMW